MSLLNYIFKRRSKMRDKYKDKNYFNDYISRHYSSQEILIKK